MYVDILREAKLLLRDEAKWTRFVCARDARGDQIRVLSDNACCWCINGALYKAAHNICAPLGVGDRELIAYWYKCIDVLDRFLRLKWDSTYRNLAQFNDHKSTEHEHVHEFLDAAIRYFTKNPFEAPIIRR